MSTQYLLSLLCFADVDAEKRVDESLVQTSKLKFDHTVIFEVSGPTEHCSIFHFPSVRSSVRHRRVISTFLDNLMG